MFTQTWKKYLPVIVILLKKSTQEDQTMNLNLTDFERAAGGRKMKYSFNNLQITNGKLSIKNKYTNIAKELAALLQENESTRNLILDQHYEISLSNDFLLTIRNTTPAVEEGEEGEKVEETVAEENDNSDENE
jgi:hypothetical protein